MDIKHYYSSRGSYLREHKKYFSAEQLATEVKFLVKALKLTRKDKIIDLACGHGRHTIELNSKGLDVDGLDFSGHLLKIAQSRTQAQGLAINFYKQDVQNIKLTKRYNKAFMFFSEFGLLDPNKVLKSVRRILKPGGLFLLDCDSVFRLINYLRIHSASKDTFDFETMKLIGKHGGSKGVQYYTPPELVALFERHGFRMQALYGNYMAAKLDPNSKRIILVGRVI